MDRKLGGLTAALFVLIPGAAGAQTFQEAKPVCEALSQYARVVMKARQDNLPMSTVLTMMENKGDSAKLADYKRRLVVEAYDELRWPFEDSKRDAVQDFENAKFLECIRRQL